MNQPLETRVQSAIIGFHQDEAGDWVADLACGHRQHVRHRPPWTLRPWVLTPEGRAGRIGLLLGCVLCDPVNGGSSHQP